MALVRTGLRYFPVSVLVLALLALLAACDGGGPGGGTATPAATATAEPVAYSFEEATEPGPYDVGVTSLTLVDTSRPTVANGDFPGSDERELVTEVWYPATIDPAAADGRDAQLDDGGAPYPLIVFAHGLASSRVQSTSYTRHLASHGYVVMAPDFPQTSGSALGGLRLLDITNQPGDVSFVIDSALAFHDAAGHLLYGAVDAESIGLTGHSYGGFTTLLTVYGPLRDDRIDAAIPLSAHGCLLSEAAVGDTSVPILMMTGSEDLIVAPQGNRLAYDLANAPRYWLELLGGSHVRFADVDIDDEVVVGRVRGISGGGAADGERTGAARCVETPQVAGAPPITLARQQELLRAFATPFFDAYLRKNADAERFLQQTLPELLSGDIRFEFELAE